MVEQLLVKRSQLEKLLDLIERAECMIPDTDTKVIDYRNESRKLREVLKNNPTKKVVLSGREVSVLDRLHELEKYMAIGLDINSLCTVGSLDCLFNKNFPKKKESKRLSKDFFKLGRDQQLNVLKTFINRNTQYEFKK